MGRTSVAGGAEEEWVGLLLLEEEEWVGLLLLEEGGVGRTSAAGGGGSG